MTQALEIQNKLNDQGYVPFDAVCHVLGYSRSQIDNLVQEHTEIGCVRYKRLRYLLWADVLKTVDADLVKLAGIPVAAAEVLKRYRASESDQVPVPAALPLKSAAKKVKK